ncbi:MAG: lysophospholipid acyltransferase family protein [Candidatus Kapabacteria bacterium]|nr:lysophospholipid acyltransferase family protein [Ignavibacteriota bacterium]MCW5883909.1 lysophospholipid acyltransferase family protein [Candidatus Kapabacteria bacterium]
MKKIIYFFSHYFMMSLGFISQKLSIKNRAAFGKLIGGFLRILSKSRSDITLKNIKNAFPEKEESEIISIRNESYQNLGITLAELLAFPSLRKEDFLNYVKFENIDLVKEKIAEGKGLIFISGHFGNWELTAYTAGLALDVPITIIVKPQRNHISDTYLNSLRTSGGNKIVPMGRAARTIIETIKKNEAVAMLVDQSAHSQKDVFVEFFGKPAVTYEAPAMIALRFKTPIVTGFAHRQPDMTYKVVIKEIKFDDLDDSKESIVELTRRHVKELEDNIIQNPGLWAWQHKRWKYSSPDNKAQ